MSAIGAWLKERIPVRPDQLRELTNEPVPNHLKRWWFCLGGTPAYLFVVQVLTGILLAFYYQASPQGAYDSVRYITDDAAFGGSGYRTKERVETEPTPMHGFQQALRLVLPPLGVLVLAPA